MKSVKCKKEWDEKLYKFALKRFGRVSNIGWYKMFMDKRDFIHDNYVAFITDEKSFEQAESLEHYFNKFVTRITYYQRLSYHTRSRLGKEFLTRNADFRFEPDWRSLENKHSGEDQFYGDSIVSHLDNFKILSMYSQGLTYDEIASKLGTYTVKVRREEAREIERFKESRIFKEFINDRK